MPYANYTVETAENVKLRPQNAFLIKMRFIPYYSDRSSFADKLEVSVV